MKNYSQRFRAVAFLTTWLLATPVSALEKFASKSFMFTRPASQNLAAEMFQWHYYFRTKQGPVLGALQIIPYYQSTAQVESLTNDEAANYFMPDCQTQLSVRGDGVVSPFPRNIRSEWLGINNPQFSGKLSLAPQQKQYGAIVEYHQDLAKFTDSKFFEPFWVSVMLPFMVVKNDPGLRQTDVMNPGTPSGPTDIIQAFKQDQWLYSRINGEQRQSGLGECKFKLGVTFATRRDAECILYSLVSIPTASKQRAQNFFAPFIGNNSHFTYGSGVAFQVPFTDEFADQQAYFFIEIEHLYMFGNTQLRTFDLVDRPWSRFLQFNSHDGLQVNVPGVNILTRSVHVRPDSFVDFVTGFRGRWRNNFEAEIGYNLWAHGTERIELKPTFCEMCEEEIPLEIYGIAGTAPATSASASTIATQAANDPAFVNIHFYDLDLQSATGGATITHKIHGGLGYGYSGEKYAGFVGFGGFYEGPQNNAALKQWGLWGKIGATF